MAQSPTQYRINKFWTFFNFLDVNKDGYISIDDFEMMAVNMTRLSNANEEQREKMIAILRGFWYIDTGGKSDTRVTIADAVHNVTDYFCTTDVRIVREALTKNHGEMFDAIDANGDNLISREELKIFYNSLGVADDDFVQGVLDLIDTDKNGVISRDEFVMAINAFWMSEDPENGYEFVFDPPRRT